MKYRDKIQESKKYNNLKLTADKIIQQLAEAFNDKSKTQRRWIWELLQNAKDIFYSISMQGKVIEIRQWRGRDDKR